MTTEIRFFFLQSRRQETRDNEQTTVVYIE